MKVPDLGSRQPEFHALIRHIHGMEPDPKVAAARTAMVYGDYDAALEILATVGRRPKPTGLIGDTLGLAGRIPEAMQHLERAEADGLIDPMRRVCFLLGLGRYSEAFPALRTRNIPPGAAPPWPRVFTLDDVAGADVFVAPEQALGDLIMMSRFIEPLRQHAARVAWGTAPQAGRLMAGLVPTPPWFVGPPRQGAVWCASQDCLEILGVSPATIPSGPYLSVPPELVDARRLPRTGKLRVGLCWSGACNRAADWHWEIDLRRSIPPEFLRPLLDVRGMKFVSLMHPGNHDPGQLPIKHVIRADFDMQDSAAIIAQLDLVITVDSSIAHLAGALGKPTWMLNRTAGCWRWGWDGAETTPWYGSMKIFTQIEPYRWTPVIERVRDELAAIV